ncbi:MAG: metal ABC transporter permease [Actinobacteria bacterium]|nr:metal ABC transporter permease [Actinomycetota bacterium]
MDALLDPIRGDFGLTTLISLTVVGAGCGAVGVWILQFGRAFLAESLTHALLPGLVAASLFGASLVIGALAGVLLAYVATLAFSRAPKTSAAASTSVTVTTLVAGGALIAASSDSGYAAFESLLFGNPVAATRVDLAAGALLLAGVTVTLWLAHERFGALAFDPAAAVSLRVSVSRVQAVLLLVIVCAVAAAVNVTGSLPALALLVGPAIAADALCTRIGRGVWIAALAGAICGAGALYLSYYADWPAGASVAITCTAAAAAASCLRRTHRSSARTGVVAQR